jgi:hypothetical protein
MGLKRRVFLQRAGWGLAAIGASEAGLLRLGDRYYQALAQPSQRKLALLVGINQYPRIQALNGCFTDVELQRELLIHRFGFKEEDILTLIDREATRQQIETAFIEHLTKQAQPGDVVVFHFSGYGRRVQLSEERGDTLNSLVPVDGVVPSGVSAVNDLPEETLWLLLRSLSTDRVTTILDTSFNHPDTVRSERLRIRSRPQLTQAQLSAEELAFQQELLSRQGSSCRQGDIASCRPMPGVVLTAASSTHLATEVHLAGFSAGLFTYALTQYLWEATPATTVQVSLSRVAGMLEQLVGKEQQPQLSGQKSQEQSALAYDLIPDTTVGANGVVKLVEDDGKTAHLWLAGLPLPVLEYYSAGSKLTLVPPNSQRGARVPLDNSSPLHLQLRSRTGLTAKALLSGNNAKGSLQAGQLVQEAVRVLPRNINLNVAFDAGLERIERVDATSAFAAIPYVSVVIAGEQPADYLFGRVQEATGSNTLSPTRYGLFSLGKELIPDTAGEPGEAVKVAVHRLAPKLQTLLAAKLWRLTMNEGASRLSVKATLETITAQERVLMQRETLRSHYSLLRQFPQRGEPPHGTGFPTPVKGSIPTLPIGSHIQYRVHNDSERPVYVLLLGLDSNRSAIALYPTEPAQETNISETKPLLKDVVIAPGGTLTVPPPAVDFEWVIHGPASLCETQLIFSSAPFTQAFAALEVAMHPKDKQEQIRVLLNPLEVAQALLKDLHQASALKAYTGSDTDTYVLDLNAWAGMNFLYQVG